MLTSKLAFFRQNIRLNPYKKVLFLVSLLLIWESFLYIPLVSFFRKDIFIPPIGFFCCNPFFILFGYAGMLVVSYIPYEKWRVWVVPLLILTTLLLVLVLIPSIGTKISGARRWIRVAFVGIQPTEILKIVVIIWLADFLARKEEKLHFFSYSLMPIMFVLSFFGCLLLLQPDFGSFVLIFTLAFILCYIAGVKLLHLFSVFGVFCVLGVFLVLMNAYRIKRILGFLSPWENRLESGYQLVNSLIAYGGGGLLGRGLGNSLQKEHFLPQAHTDFIFAVLAEETGIFGILFTCFLFLALMKVGFQIATNAKTLFGRYLAFGIVSLILIQTLMNLFVVLGLAPTKGIGLPLISYGGSSLVFFLFAIGILLNIAKDSSD